MDTLPFMAMEATGVEDEKSIIHGDCPCCLQRGRMAGVLEKGDAGVRLPGCSCNVASQVLLII
jgi:hypothetical protein